MKDKLFFFLLRYGIEPTKRSCTSAQTARSNVTDKFDVSLISFDYRHCKNAWILWTPSGVFGVDGRAYTRIRSITQRSCPRAEFVDVF